MLTFRRSALAAVILAALSVAAYAAGLFPNFPIVGQPSYSAGVVNVPAGPSFLTGNELIPADTEGPGGVAPQTVTIPVTLLGNFGGTPRNYLGNGDLIGTQVNGTATVTCATTAAPVAANISADRWECDANVTSGAGRTAIVTSTPSPPTGYVQVMKVFRTSGALTQPVCVWQAVPNSTSLAMAGNSVTFSAWLDALAGLAADNANQVQMVIITGTGTDQGFNGSWTASPAITPAWTGIATAINQTLSITTTFTRYSVTAAIPSTTTEVGVGLCFTPTATGAGATDGFAFTGAQLELGKSASPYEFRSQASTIADNMMYLYNINEGAATKTRAMCMASSVTLAICGLKFAVPMYKVPTMSYANGFATATTVAGSTLGACTTLRTSTLVAGNAATAEGVLVDCVAGTVPAAGSADYLADNGGTGVITAWTGL